MKMDSWIPLKESFLSANTIYMLCHISKATNGIKQECTQTPDTVF